MALVPRVFGPTSSVFDPFSADVFDPFSLDLFDPFQSLTTPFQSLAIRPAFSNEVAALANTRIDWRETPEAHVFKADLPGLKKEEVKVEVEEGNVLQISGERTKEDVQENDRWYRAERSSGKFLRRFRLPEDARMDQVKATMENGVLTVTVPKEGVKKPEVKAIKIDGQSDEAPRRRSLSQWWRNVFMCRSRREADDA